MHRTTAAQSQKGDRCPSADRAVSIADRLAAVQSECCWLDPGKGFPIMVLADWFSIYLASFLLYYYMNQASPKSPGGKP